MDANASPEALFRRNSRSFSLAARLFRPDDQLAVARLYRFCRYLDDLADDTARGEPERLDRVRVQLTSPETAPADSIAADFNALAVERSIPVEPALELIDALRADCGTRVIINEAELIRFAYGVAGTVGQMMCSVIGACDEKADAFAIDLGIALQLSNIMRDVAEDARRGRFYLPQNGVKPTDIEAALAGNIQACQKVDQAVRRTFDLAETYYESAQRGFVYIPGRNRRVIFLAMAFYRAIGQKVVRQASGGWRERTVVSPWEKLAILTRAPQRYRRLQKQYWLREPEPQHDVALHQPLESGSKRAVFNQPGATG